MTTLTPCELTDQLSVRQLGLIARAVDVHRQAQVRRRDRTTNPAERAMLLTEIGDLRKAASLFKQAEERMLASE